MRQQIDIMLIQAKGQKGDIKLHKKKEKKYNNIQKETPYI